MHRENTKLCCFVSKWFGSMTELIPRKSSCVNARGIPTAAYQVLHMLSYPGGTYLTGGGVPTLARGWEVPTLAGGGVLTLAGGGVPTLAGGGGRAAMWISRPMGVPYVRVVFILNPPPPPQSVYIMCGPIEMRVLPIWDSHFQHLK